MKRLSRYWRQIYGQRNQGYRRAIQYGFLIVIAWIGIEFSYFVIQLERAMHPTVARPPGIEAFLPISSLISLKYWLVGGIFNDIHPSGLIILLMVLSTAVLLKRGFCSWVCPFGLLTEYLGRIHCFLFKEKKKIPRWLDYPLRSLKYLLLAFFLWAIAVQMDAAALDHFIHSPYNMVADIKMYYFFARITPFACGVLAALFVLTILVRNFWCRYLCPYGALLGVLSFFSIFKIHRNQQTCTKCKRCSHACPVDIKVHNASCVISDECHACLKCVSVCPEKDTLHISAFRRKAILKPWVYATAICLLFIGGSVAGRITGKWQTSISNSEYLFHVKHLGLPIYRHNRGQVPDYNKESWLRMMEAIREAGSKRSSG